MKILVSGSRGTIGSALMPFLRSEGNDVTPLSRGRSDPGVPAIEWNPTDGLLDEAPLRGFDAVIHLAGESIATRWSTKKKAKIRESRILGTRLLAETLAHISPPPKVFVSASAIGFYGNRGSETLDESSAPGSDFLAEVCRDWEGATKPVADKGVRVVHLRTGIVLSSRGGALPRMAMPFRLGLGGRVGNGRQYMSWIAIEDWVRIVGFVLAHASIKGPVNAVAPGAVTNREFARALGRALHRPAIFPLPAFAVKLLFGEMGETIILSSQRVQPARLLAEGFEFKRADLETALGDALNTQGQSADVSGS